MPISQPQTDTRQFNGNAGINLLPQYRGDGGVQNLNPYGSTTGTGGSPDDYQPLSTQGGNYNPPAALPSAQAAPSYTAPPVYGGVTQSVGGWGTDQYGNLNGQSLGNQIGGGIGGFLGGLFGRAVPGLGLLGLGKVTGNLGNTLGSAAGNFIESTGKSIFGGIGSLFGRIGQPGQPSQSGQPADPGYPTPNSYPSFFGSFNSLPGEIGAGPPVSGYDLGRGQPIYNARGVLNNAPGGTGSFAQSLFAGSRIGPGGVSVGTAYNPNAPQRPDQSIGTAIPGWAATNMNEVRRRNIA